MLMIQLFMCQVMTSMFYNLKMQDDLLEVQNWCESHNMFINCNKTKCMVIGTRQRLASRNIEPIFLINGETLQNSNCEKLLGVKIDNHLSWNSQIDQVCSNISSRLFLLSKIKKFLNLESRKLFYTGYILPLIDYCCVVWSNCNNECVQRLQKLQKRAARLILDTDPLASSLPLIKKLGWMKIEHRILYHKCLLTFKCLHNLAPVYLTEKVTPVSRNNPYQLRNVLHEELYVPRANTELFKKSFYYSGPYEWNNLPYSLRDIKSISSFKEKLKLYFMNCLNDELGV